MFLVRGVLPIMAYKGRSTRKGYIFQVSGHERAGILLVEAYKSRQGNLSFGSVKGPQGLTDDFYGFIKSRKRFSFVIDSYLKDSAFTAVKRDATF